MYEWVLYDEETGLFWDGGWVEHIEWAWTWPADKEHKARAQLERLDSDSVRLVRVNRVLEFEFD